MNDKINQFTKDRLIKIKDGKIPIHFARFGKACLHIVPSDAFTIGNPLDIQKIFDNTFILNINGFIPQYNDNGVMLFKKNQEGVCISYCQIFRNSILEIVYSLHQHQHANDKQIPYKYEHKLTALLHEKLTFLKKIGVKPHIFISLALVDVSGYKITYPERLNKIYDDRAITEEILLTTTTLIESYTVQAMDILNPMFDIVWQVCGYPKSLSNV